MNERMLCFLLSENRLRASFYPIVEREIIVEYSVPFHKDL